MPLGIISLIVGTVLGLVGLWLGYLGLRLKRPAYMVRGMNLASTLPTGFGKLSIHSGRKKVTDATLTDICLWNSGFGTVEHKDFSTSQPLRLSLNGEGALLACEVMASSRPSVVLDFAKLNESSYALLCESLGYKDWILFRVIHSGGRPGDCVVSGELKDRGNVRKANPDVLRRKMRWLCISAIPVSILLVCGVFPYCVLGPFLNIDRKKQESWVRGVDTLTVVNSPKSLERLGILNKKEIAVLDSRLAKRQPEFERNKREATRIMAWYFTEQIYAAAKSAIPLGFPLALLLFFILRLRLTYGIPMKAFSRNWCFGVPDYQTVKAPAE